MVDIRKIIIIFVIGILFSVLVFAVIEAVYPRPDYSDFCKDEFIRNQPIKMDTTDCAVLDVSVSTQNSCNDKKGYISYEYDSVGCPISYKCETCNVDYQAASDDYSKIVFYISAILALIAIFIGMYLPAKANTLNEWVGTGFMLGGTFALFFGTMQSYQALDRIIRPLVIFFELALVIFIAYKKIGNLSPDKKK